MFRLPVEVKHVTVHEQVWLGAEDSHLISLILLNVLRPLFLRAHSWLNWVNEDDDEHDEFGLKKKPEDTRYIKKITSK